MAGTKHDSGKPMITLVRPDFIIGVAEAMTFGAKKYGKYNYRQGLEYTRILDAAFRHLLSIANGVDVDEESGLPHTVLVGSNMNMLHDLMKNGLGVDNRLRATIQSADFNPIKDDHTKDRLGTDGRIKND